MIFYIEPELSYVKKSYIFKKYVIGHTVRVIFM